MKKLGLGQKIKSFRLKKGVKQKDFALMLGVTPQAISGWERGVTYPQVELYEKIATTLEVPKSWLFFEEEEKSIDKNILFVPFYSNIEASAGDGFLNEYSEVEQFPLPKQHLDNQLNKKDIFCIKCCGNSMEPIISDGSILAVNRSMNKICDGGIYLINVGGALRVKVLYIKTSGIVIRSYSNEYEDELITDNEKVEATFEVIGKVIWYSSNIK